MLGLLAALAAQVAAPPPNSWPTHEQDVILKDFRFRDDLSPHVPKNERFGCLASVGIATNSPIFLADWCESLQ